MLVEALEIFGLIISVITNTGSGASDTTFPTHPYVEYIQEENSDEKDVIGVGGLISFTSYPLHIYTLI